ncbi:ABC transporter ATP-binding protein [Roseburia hominis]
MNSLLEMRHVTVSFFTYDSTVQAVRDISFSMEEGQTVALVGESGCGKSVTAKSIMGLVKKPGKVLKESQILFNGVDVSGYSDREWEKFRGKECSMIFQDALVSLNPTMQIGKQIIESLDNHDSSASKEDKRKRAVKMLELTGIADAENCLKKYPHELSGGMRQRVMIAIALITHPKLLIADEPTTSLDVTIQAQILSQMKTLQKQMNMAILLITHDLGIVADTADKIIVMYAGKIVEEGLRKDIFYHPAHPYTKALLGSVPRLDGVGKHMLQAIEGSIPDMTNPPKGCAFCERCPYAMRICEQYMPEEKYVSDTHRAACWLMDERAGRRGTENG